MAVGTEPDPPEESHSEARLFSWRGDLRVARVCKGSEPYAAMGTQPLGRGFGNRRGILTEILLCYAPIPARSRFQACGFCATLLCLSRGLPESAPRAGPASTKPVAA